MLKKLVAAFIICFVSFMFLLKQTKEEIQKKQQQLLQEISDLNKTLDQVKKNKKQNPLGQLALVQQKYRRAGNSSITLTATSNGLNDVIYTNQIQIYRYKKEIDTLKEQYAKSLVFAYKNRSNYDYLNFLFSRTSV
jgi:outer membrane lipoprotein-sorting protein